ncbi:MAG: DUF4974 domain-containing protein [Pseudomonadales bacterium]|jgi:hypothetical protein|nr:DUF4974 domain-containing protein [Pseudomonadales bacterium]
MKKWLPVFVLTIVLPSTMLLACAPEEIRALRSAHRVVAGEILSVSRVAQEDRKVTYSIEAEVREVLLGAPMEENTIRVQMNCWGPKEDPSYEQGKSYVIYLRREPAEGGEGLCWVADHGATSVQPDSESLREKLGAKKVGKDRSFKMSQEGVDVEDLSPLDRKLHAVVIPEMDFRCARAYDVIDFFHMASIDFDKSSPEGQKGVNICLNGQSFAEGRVPLINFYFEDISLLQALTLVVALADAERTTIDDWIIVSEKGGEGAIPFLVIEGEAVESKAYQALCDSVVAEVDFRQASPEEVARFLSQQSGVTVSVSGSAEDLEEVGAITLIGRHSSPLTILKVLSAMHPLDVHIKEESVTITPSVSPSHGGSSEPVVGHLKTRDKVITIRAGEGGPLYTIKSEGGAILAADLTHEELAAKFPDLKRVVQGGIADWAGTTGHQSIEISR